MNSGQQAPIMRLEGVSLTFQTGDRKITPLRCIDFSVKEHDFIAIMGPSGAGKTSLLSVLGCLTTPSEGRVFFNEQNISQATDSELSTVRGEKIGFIFQSFFLIPYLNSCQNVALPLLYSGRKIEHINELAKNALERVGLADRLTHKPSELSGGEMQRVAIARALITSPRIILADEPTGSLDSATGSAILDIFDAIHAQGTALLIATHDLKVAARAKTVLHIKDGIFPYSL